VREMRELELKIKVKVEMKVKKKIQWTKRRMRIREIALSSLSHDNHVIEFFHPTILILYISIVTCKGIKDRRYQRERERERRGRKWNIRLS